MLTSLVNPSPWIDRLVGQLREAGVLKSEDVERAFRRVHRHLFLERFFSWEPPAEEEEPKEPQLVEVDLSAPESEHLDLIYSDSAIITRLGEDAPTSSCSQPTLSAQMLELLQLGPAMRVLEIGAGTGYFAPLLAEIVGPEGAVITVEIQEEVARDASRALRRAGYPQVHVVAADGYLGAPAGAPFDRIVATVGCTDLSPQWVNQLQAGGFMLLPLLHGGMHPLVRVWIEDGDFLSEFQRLSNLVESGDPGHWAVDRRFYRQSFSLGAQL